MWAAPASLEWTSTHMHQSAAGSDGCLTMDQRGLFDGVLVEEGGHKHDGLRHAGKLWSVQRGEVLGHYRSHQ